MLSRQSLSALPAAERLLLRQQWLRSTQHKRCFHASLRARADGEDAPASNATVQGATPAFTPSTRTQRAAQISQDLRQLNRTPPPPRTDTPTPSHGIGPGSLEEDAPPSPGRMGQNDGPGREGPNAQGAARPVRSIDDDDAGGQSQQVRGVRGQAGGKIEEPAEGGAAVLETTTAPQPTSRAVKRLPTAGVSFRPQVYTKATLLSNGANVSTIAGANFSGVVSDRVNLLSQSTHPASSTSPRDPQTLARNLLNQRAGSSLVSFASSAERDEVLSLARDITHRGQSISAQVRATMKPDDPSPYFKPVGEAVKKSVLDKMVNGVYDAEGILQGKGKYKQPVLNNIAVVMAKNGTYLNKDAERVLRKVRGLLPAVAPARAQQVARK